MQIMAMTADDFRAFWPTFQAVVQARETYAIDPDLGYTAAYALWCERPQESHVAKQDDVILGSYYLKPNAAGPGDHICNCGYMVAPAARGRGVARALCQHSQQRALSLGYRAMQFNAVVATNQAAIALWRSLGFETLGRVPNSFRHAREGFVDTLIMFKELRDPTGDA